MQMYTLQQNNLFEYVFTQYKNMRVNEEKQQILKFMAIMAILIAATYIVVDYLEQQPLSNINSSTKLKNMIQIKKQISQILNQTQSLMNAKIFDSNDEETLKRLEINLIGKQQIVLKQFSTKDMSTYSNKFPKKVWMFLNNTSSNKFNKLLLYNIKHFCRPNEFQLNIFNKNDDLNWLSKQALDEIALRTNRQHLTLDVIQRMRNHLVKLFTLHEKGGIWLQQSLMLYESLQWVNQLSQNQFVINKVVNRNPEIFTFYSSPFQQRPFQANGIYGQYLTDGKIEQNLIAAIPRSKLIGAWLQEYLVNEAQLSSKISKSKTKQDFTNQYEKIFTKALQDVIQRKQRSLENTKEHACHYYGLWQLKSELFSYKLLHTANYDPHIEADSLTQIAADRVKYLSGPIRYIQVLNHDVIQQLFGLTRGFNNYSKIHPESIFSQYLLLKKKYLDKNKEEKYIMEEKSIRAYSFDFPKIVWIYWATGYQKMDLIQQLCLNNIKHFIQATGYELRLLSDQNCYDFISSESVQLIQTSLNKHKLETSKATKSDLVRLALLLEHGGVYFDETVILLEDLTWLQTVHYNQYTLGRTSTHPPQVFMWYNTQHQMHEFVWDDKIINPLIKSPGLQSSFIAAVKGSQFIRECRDKHIELLLNTKQYYLDIIENNQLMVGSSLRLQYFIVMGSFQVVLQMKQKQLDFDGKGAYAMHHYGIIALDARAGPYHIELNAMPISNYVNVVEFMLRRPISYAQNCFGQGRYLLKLHHENIIPLSALIDKLVDQKLQMARQSYVEKFLFLIPANRQLIKYDW